MRVLERAAPKPGQRVNVEVWLGGTLVTVASNKTDARGEAHFTLGQSARSPYRFALAGNEPVAWEWLAVGADRHHEVVLKADEPKPFDPAAKPSRLGFAEWQKP